MVTSNINQENPILQARNTEFSTLNRDELRPLTTSGIYSDKASSAIESKSYSAKESIRRKLTARVTPMTRDNGDNFEKRLNDGKYDTSKTSKTENRLFSWKGNPTTTDKLSISPITVKKEFVGPSSCSESRKLSLSRDNKHRNFASSEDCQPPPKCPKLAPSLIPISSNALASNMNHFLPEFAPGPRSFTVNPMTSLLTASQGHLATLQDEDGDTPLHIAIAQSKEHLVQYLTHMTLASGISLDIYNKLKQTPLHLAVITNQPSIVRILICAGVNANIPDRNGQTAIHLTCQRSSVECLMELVNCRHPINFAAKNYNGLTPLHEAVMSNSLEIIRFLVACGADVDSKDGKSGRTPLHYAVEQEYLPIIQLLIHSGANVSAASFSGSTPIQTASGRGMHDVTTLLLSSTNEVPGKCASTASSNNSNVQNFKVKKMPRK